MTMANKARAPLDFVNPEAAEAARTGTLNIEMEEVRFPSPSLYDAVDRRTCLRAARRIRK